MTNSTAVLHIPHSSTLIPKNIRDQIRLSDAELSTELLRMTDWYTDELFSDTTSDIKRVVFPVSRLVLDPERFESDDDEPMSRVGMGVVYKKTSHGSDLRLVLSDDERSALINRFYHPHHSQLTDNVDQILKEHGQALVIDCHSFPNIALPYESDQNPNRPDICLGTDSFHTPEGLITLAKECFESNGYYVNINRPFAGALVPSKHYYKDSRVYAIMIEVNRSLYIDEATGDKNLKFQDIAKIMSGIVSTLSGWTMESEN